MGNNNSQPNLMKFADDLSWDMTKSEKNNIGLYFDNNIKNIHIICPLQNEKDKVIKIKLDKFNFLNIMKLFKDIHKMYKGKKIDHVFFEGFEFVKKTKDTVTYVIITGS